MFRRLPALIALVFLTVFVAGCHHNKVANPIANVNSKQPDKVLFDRAMDAMNHGKYDVARMTLQTLINTYPDSEYVARAKLAVGDSWYAEGSTAALQQAEIEYKDFETFFPNMPEAAEAQMKVANIHFKQMEKADRDSTHARRAEEEYRDMIMQYPDSKLVPQAKEKLRAVQEVLAQREFEIGRFYYLRESWPAAIARLKSLTDAYPLFSQADEALYMLGNANEKEAELVRGNHQQVTGTQAQAAADLMKKRAIEAFDANAADAYSKILTRYPVMGRAGDAKARLEALKKPVPTATPEAIAQNKAEEESRSSTGMLGRLMLTFHRGPDMAQAAGIGDPTITAPTPTSATDVVNAATRAMVGAPTSGGGAEGKVAVERVTGNGANGNTAPANNTEPSNVAPAPAATTNNVQPGTAAEPATAQPNPANAQPAQQENTGIDELKPSAPAAEPPKQPENVQPPTAQTGLGTTPQPGSGTQPDAQIQTGIKADDSANSASQN